MEKLLLTPKEVQVALGISRPQVYKMLTDGTLPSIRIGRLIRISSAELHRWIEAQPKTKAG